jgi:hypothetical protein
VVSPTDQAGSQSCPILLDCSQGASVQDPRRGDSTTTLNGLLGSVALTLAVGRDGSKPSQSFCQPNSGRRMEVEMEWFLVLIVLVLVVCFTFS